MFMVTEGPITECLLYKVELFAEVWNKLKIKQLDSQQLKPASNHSCSFSLQMDGINYIPNGVDFKSDQKTFCIITGPNLGGKSTHLRSTALNVLMAQVPQSSIFLCRGTFLHLIPNPACPQILFFVG